MPHLIRLALFFKLREHGWPWQDPLSPKGPVHAGVTVVSAPKGSVHTEVTIVAAPKGSYAGVTVVTAPKGSVHAGVTVASRTQWEKNTTCLASMSTSPVQVLIVTLDERNDVSPRLARCDHVQWDTRGRSVDSQSLNLCSTLAIGTPCGSKGTSDFPVAVAASFLLAAQASQCPTGRCRATPPWLHLPDVVWKVGHQLSWPAESTFALWANFRIVGWYSPSRFEMLSICMWPRDREVWLSCPGARKTHAHM